MESRIIVNGVVEASRYVGIDLPKQIRYATMQAINDAAKAVQKHELEEQLPSKLTLRSRGTPWWKPGNKFGINIRPYATRRDLRAVIGSQADWLKFQEEGGTKTGQGHRLAIEAGARPGKESVIPRNLKPRQLLVNKGDVRTLRSGKTRTARKDGRGFIINTKSGPAIFIREGDSLKLMYMLEQSAKIPAILEFFKSGLAVVEKLWPTLFERRFQNAVATAR